MRKNFIRLFLVVSCFVAASVSAAIPESTPPSASDKLNTGTPVVRAVEASPKVFEEKGIRVTFAIEPSEEGRKKQDPIREGEFAGISFRVTDAASGAPISPLQPGVWVDMIKDTGAKKLSCRERVSRYLQGSLSYQADIDLNRYFLLVMNNDHTISVIDPILGIPGYTQLQSMVLLKDPGEDWVSILDANTLYVTMPKAGQVAVVNLETFKVEENIDAGNSPMRIALQPDQHYLWVGNDGMTEGESGVTVIDVLRRAVVAFIPTGPGHHEIAFSADSLHAFVTNSAGGTLSIIDIQNLKKIKNLDTGPNPVAVEFSTLSNAAYVGTEQEGNLLVVDAATLEITQTILTAPGLIAFRFAPGERWGFAANTRENRVDIIDAGSGKIAQQVDVGAEPYQFAFTDNYAYVRCLGAPEVSLIKLSQLGTEAPLSVQKVPFGSRAPGANINPGTGSVGSLPAFANSITPTGEWGTVMVANQAENMIYYYMEGMVAPMGSFQNYSRIPRAIGIVDRSLAETEKGVYSAKFRVPRQGTYSVAFVLDTPWIDHCFEFTAEESLLGPREEPIPVKVEVLTQERTLTLGQETTLFFDLKNPEGDQHLNNLGDVSVLITRSPGNWQNRQVAQMAENGSYAATLRADSPGIYYVFFLIPSLGVEYNMLPFLVFRAEPDTPPDAQQ